MPFTNLIFKVLMSKLIFSCGEEDEQECICISELVKPTSVLTTAISTLESHISLCCSQAHSVPVLLLFLSLPVFVYYISTCYSIPLLLYRCYSIWMLSEEEERRYRITLAS